MDLNEREIHIYLKKKEIPGKLGLNLILMSDQFTRELRGSISNSILDKITGENLMDRSQSDHWSNWAASESIGEVPLLDFPRKTSNRIHHQNRPGNGIRFFRMRVSKGVKQYETRKNSILLSPFFFSIFIPRNEAVKDGNQHRLDTCMRWSHLSHEVSPQLWFVESGWELALVRIEASQIRSIPRQVRFASLVQVSDLIWSSSGSDPITDQIICFSKIKYHMNKLIHLCFGFYFSMGIGVAIAILMQGLILNIDIWDVRKLRFHVSYFNKWHFP